MSRITFELNDVADECLEIENLKISNISNIKVIDSAKDIYYVNCKCATLNLIGNFVFNTTRTCVNNYGELIDIEPDFLELTNLLIDNFEFIIKITNSKGDLLIEYLDKYVIGLTNEIVENSYYDHCEDYIEAIIDEDCEQFKWLITKWLSLGVWTWVFRSTKHLITNKKISSVRSILYHFKERKLVESEHFLFLFSFLDV